MRSLSEIRDYWDTQHEAGNTDTLTGSLLDTVMKQLHLQYILGGNILEVGVGTGNVVRSLHNKGYNISCVDISDRAIEPLREYCEAVYLVDNIANLPDDYFDLIICINTIQHIPTYILKDELFHLIRSLKPESGVFTMQFVSCDVSDDTGIGERWDRNIGCYGRTPEVMGALITEAGGEYITIDKEYGKFGDTGQVTGNHVFHIYKN